MILFFHVMVKWFLNRQIVLAIHGFQIPDVVKHIIVNLDRVNAPVKLNFTQKKIYENEFASQILPLFFFKTKKIF